MPVDEMRSLAVEAKLAHEAGLLRLLEQLEQENDGVESSVAALEARARKVLASIAVWVDNFANVRPQKKQQLRRMKQLHSLASMLVSCNAQAAQACETLAA